MTANAGRLLIEHYVDNFRRLPWRTAPGEGASEPYLVWLSEVMLQQTTVATVMPRFERFVRRWPTIDALASATDEDILAEWAGLGYYARARNLIACAREVVRRGGFPRTSAELRRLPGLGDYTAGAIAAIAFGERAPAVDTNVGRVIARLHGLRQSERREIESYVLAMMTDGRPGDVIQALMDLGATICRPKNPRCGACPVAVECRAFASGWPESFPQTQPRKPRPHRVGTAYWTERAGCVWLTRRPPKGLLGGMPGLPGTDWSSDEIAPANAIGSVRHVFTHFSLELHLAVATRPAGHGWWQPIERLDQAGLPTLYRRAAELMMGVRRAA